MINLVDEKWNNVFIDVNEIKAIIPNGNYAEILLGGGITVKVIWGQYEYDRYIQELDERRVKQNNRPIGEWIEQTIYNELTKEDENYNWRCANCGWEQPRRTYFCPNCGADMRGEEE